MSESSEPDSVMMFMADVPGGTVPEGTAMMGRWIELDEIDGRWVADPISAHTRPVVAEVELALPAGSADSYPLH
jgi:hypothetical protein